MGAGQLAEVARGADGLPLVPLRPSRLTRCIAALLRGQARRARLGALRSPGLPTLHGGGGPRWLDGLRLDGDDFGGHVDDGA